MTQGNLYINGQWIEGNGSLFFSLNPATGETIWAGKAANTKQVNDSVRAARMAFYKWQRLSFDDRYKLLENFCNILENKQEFLTEVLARETGKPLWEAKTEFIAMRNKLGISKTAYFERCNKDSKDMGEFRAVVRAKPHGVVVVLCPFNFPGHIPNGHIMPALLAGNTVIIKPSELTPYISEEITKCWQEAGLPDGVINMLQGPGQVGVDLCEHNGIDGIFFTGSSSTGLQIQETLIKYPHRIIALEMGGNNPLIVHEINDIDAAVYNTIQSAYITAGQRCTCARRLIVPNGAEGDKFVERLSNVIDKITIGLYTDSPEPFMGTVISNNAANQILSQYRKYVSKGAIEINKLHRKLPDAALLTPGLIDISKNAEVDDIEIFGPLLKLIRSESFNAAIDIANQTQYGLSAGLLSDNPDNYNEFFENIRAGIVNWNRPLTGASSDAPFGGIGKSGNHHPSAYYAADYCSFPVASLESPNLTLPKSFSPGLCFD